MYLRIRDISIITKQKRIYDQIIEYQRVRRKITAVFHNYYMSTRQRILATPLQTDNNVNFNHKTNEIDLLAISADLKKYSSGYIALGQDSITLNIHHNENILLKIKIDTEIFYQIIFSILCNILYFVKNLSNPNISILFDQEFVEFKYDKAFSVNDEILKINSDPLMLNEISEPFVIGFGNIFDTLNSLNIKYNIEHKGGINSIKILLNTSNNRNNLSSVIDITQNQSHMQHNNISSHWRMQSE